jgi:hypothetical protein
LETIAGRIKQIAEQGLGTELLLQTYGDPKAERPQWGAVGQALEDFGGTPTVWDSLDGTGNYALVGAAYPGQETTATRQSSTKEASGPMEGVGANEALAPWVGTARGLIGRGPNGLPVIRASTSLPRGTIKISEQEAREDEEEEKEGEAVEKELKPGESENDVSLTFNPFEMITLAESPPQPWPLSDPKHEAALEWISQKLKLGDPHEAALAEGWCFAPTTWDLRAEYCNGNLAGEWDELGAKMAGLGYEPGHGFEAPELSEEVKQLRREFRDIPDVHDMFAALREPFEGTSGGLAQVFAKGAEKVDKDVLTPEAQELKARTAQDIFDALLTPAQDAEFKATDEVAEDAATDGLSLFFGLVESGLNLALEYAESKEGKPAASPLNAETSEAVVTEAEDRIKDAVRGLGTLEEIIMTDWTKLSVAHARAKRAAWSIKPKTIEGIEESLEAGSKAWFYETIMSASYGQLQATPENGVSVGELKGTMCKKLAGLAKSAVGIPPPEETWFPFEGATESNTFRPVVGVSSSGAPVPANYIWLIANLQKQYAEVPTEALTKSLFEASDKGGIGLYPAPFFTWDFTDARHNLTEFTEHKVAGLGGPDSCVGT